MQKKAAPTAKQAPTRAIAPIARTSTNPKGPERSLLALPVSDTAQHGVAGTAVPLPFMDAIQKSFGPYHDLSSVSAHVDARAAGASRALGARAYAFGDHVAFAKPPTLELAAHEAAHVVQQRGRRSGDDEQIASRVAERVVAGRSAMNLLSLPVSYRARERIVQRDAADDAKALRDDLVRDATNKLDALRKQAAIFSNISQALRLILLLSRDDVKLDTVDDITALEDESRAAASGESQTWSLLQADGRGDDFLFANGEAFPELLATRIYNVGHLFGPDENKLLAERDAKEAVARRLGHAMENEIWDKGLPVSQGDAASMTEGNLAALALSNKQFDADPGEAITQYARALLDWERTESHYSLVHFHEFTLGSRLKAIRAGTTVIRSQKDFDDTTAGTAFDRTKLRMFEEAAKAPDDHKKALQALILFHPDRDVRLTFYRWTAEERAPFDIAIDNVDSRLANIDWYWRMWRGLVWAHERSFLLDSALDAFRAIKEHPWKTLNTVFAIIGLQAIPGVDVAIDVILLIEFGWGILETAWDLYQVFKKAAHATTVVEMEHAAAAMGGAIGGAAAELLMFAATWGISKFAAKAMKYRAGKKFLTENHGSLEAKKALAATRGDVAKAEATLAKQRAEALARAERERIVAEQRHQAEIAEKHRLREEAAERQRKAEAERKADEAAKREADEATEAKRKADEAAKQKADEAAHKAEANRKRETDEAAAKAEAKRKQDLADKAAADKRAADRKAVDDRKAKAKAKKDAEAAKRDPKSPTFEPRSAAERLAMKKGMKPAPEGYNWRTIKVDGEDIPVIARSARRGVGGNPRPKIRWNPKIGDFEPVSKVWENFEYSDFGRKKPCFPPGTLIKTPHGDRRIEELVVGDTVWSFDVRCDMRLQSTVTAVYRNWTERLAVLHVGEHQMLATRMHSFWVQSLRGWHPARALWPDMTLLALDGDAPRVTGLDVLEGRSDTYNLEIADTHNYFAGALGLLVHNGEPSLDSIFANTKDPKTNRIYRVWENVVVDGKAVKRTIYVGKTYQGEDVRTRFKQHLRDLKKPTWQAKFDADLLDIEELAHGEWTAYETAVWEKHYIEVYRMENPNLLNVENPIGKTKFNEFRDLHMPCK